MFIRTNRIKITFATLLLISLALIVIHTFQGARVTSIETSGNLASQIISINLNNNLDQKVELQVESNPKINSEYSISGNTITLKIIEPLKTGTTYTFTVSNITDVRGKKSKATYELQTSAQQYAYLQRNPNGVDKIILKSIGDDTEETLVELSNISDFAIGSDQTILVITEEKSPRLYTTLYKIKNGKMSTLQIPDGVATNITSNATSDNFILQTRNIDTQSNKLYRFTEKDDEFKELTNNDGSSIHATDVLIASDSRTLLYQTATTTDAILDNFDDHKPPLNYGTTAKIHDFASDDSYMLVETKPGIFSEIDQKGGVKEIKTMPAVSDLLITQNEKLVQIQNLYNLSGDSRIELSISSNNLSQVLYKQPIDEGTISRLTRNITSEFISVEQASEPIIYDNYQINPRPENVKLIIFDSNQNVQIENINGTLLQWL